LIWATGVGIAEAFAPQPKNVMAGLDPAIHAFTNIRTWAPFYQLPMSQNKKAFLLLFLQKKKFLPS